jgi:hypothetical protein
LLDPGHGTILCTRCASKEHASSAVEVGSEVLGLLAGLKDRPLSDCSPQLLEGVGSEAASVTGRLLALHLTRPLKSIRFIAQTMADGGTRSGEVPEEGCAASVERR